MIGSLVKKGVGSVLGALGLNKVLAIAGGVAALAVVTALGLFFLHYRGMVQDLATERANAAGLEAALNVQKATTESALSANKEWKSAIEMLTARVEQMAKVSEAANARSRFLADWFARNDLSKLARSNAPDLELRVNAGTERLWSELEAATGGLRASPGGAPSGQAPATQPSPRKDAPRPVGGADAPKSP